MYLKEAIYEAADGTCVRMRGRRRNRWFNEDCEAAVANRKKARLNMLQNRISVEHAVAYRLANRECKRIIKRAKRRQMMERLEKINDDNSMGRAKSFFGEIKMEKKGI